jgi:hypothetical protein
MVISREASADTRNGHGASWTLKPDAYGQRSVIPALVPDVLLYNLRACCEKGN